MKSKSEKEKIELKKRLAHILRLPSNRTCADCPENRPTWISFIKPQQNFALGSKVLASFVCLECAGLHRKLGTHICIVRSISHDQFEKKDVDCAEYSGNDVVNEIFEGHLQKSTMDGINIKPLLGAEVARRERFIRQKYVDLYFYRKRAHYQHIAEVNKMVSQARLKPSKSKSMNSPTKPHRKKLSYVLRDDNSEKSEKDAKTSGCSTTVANTTSTRTHTSMTLTTTEDRDDSNNTDNHKSREKKSSKKRSKSNKSLKKRKKGEKSSSRRRSKSKKKPDTIEKTPSNVLPEDQPTSNVETSAIRKEASSGNDAKSKDPANIDVGISVSRESDDLSGMILVFDEESCESLVGSPTQQRRRSSRDLDRDRRSCTIGTSSRTDEFGVDEASHDSFESPRRERRSSRDFDRANKRNSTTNTPSSTKSRVYPSTDQNNQMIESCSFETPRRERRGSRDLDGGRRKNTINSEDFEKKPLRRCRSDTCGRAQRTVSPVPRATSLRDVRRSRNEATPNQKTKKRGKNPSIGPSLRIDHNRADRYSPAEKAKLTQRKSNSSRKLKAMLSDEGETTPAKSIKGAKAKAKLGTPLTSHLKKDKNRIQSRSTGNLKISPLEMSPMSIEGIVSEETSYGFGDHTVNNMSGTGEKNHDEISADDGFKVIDSETISDRSSSCKGVSWDTPSSLLLPLKNATIKNLGAHGNNEITDIESRLSRSNAIAASLSLTNDYQKIDKTNRTISNDELVRKHPRRSKNRDVDSACNSPPSKKNRSSKKRGKKGHSKSSKSEKKVNLRNQALFEEWERLKNENEKKFVEFEATAFHKVMYD